jgi:hypothetical protein
MRRTPTITLEVAGVSVTERNSGGDADDDLRVNSVAAEALPAHGD